MKGEGEAERFYHFFDSCGEYDPSPPIMANPVVQNSLGQSDGLIILHETFR